MFLEMALQPHCRLAAVVNKVAVALHQLAVQKMGKDLQEGSVVQYVVLQRWTMANSPIRFSLVVILDPSLCHKAAAEVVLTFLVSNNYNESY
jgi:predicted cupin superfamily sugar epimerase